ncbi:MAG TPA: DinB family protein [Streptosporangiaceae bacterium]|nr:DinB family protein [Streptosporangiaceae bacterium]
MSDAQTTSWAAPAAAGAAENQDEESRTLLAFLRYQRDAVLKIVEGLPEKAWQTPVVPSGWTVAGMLFHLGGVEHHWLQNVVTGRRDEPPPAEAEDGAEEAGEYDPYAAFTCGRPAADLIASYREECRRSDEVLAVTPLSATPRGLGFHPDPEYAAQITSVRWIVLHVIEETAAHSGHLEIARELLDGKTRLSGR